MAMTKGLLVCSLLMAVFVAGTLAVSVLQFVTAATGDDSPDILSV